MQSDKLTKLPPYLFAELDRKKRELRAKGADVIDLSIGDPDIPTPKHIIDALVEAARDPAFHRYPPYNGTEEFRVSAVNYLKRRSGVNLDPASEVLTLIGSKEGIAHSPFAFINSGDVVLVPSPGYPVYSTSTILAGGVPYEMPLKKENGFLPDLNAIPQDVLKKAKLLFINYPNNPTSAIATKEFFEEVVEFGRRHKLLICHDAAYIEMVYDGYKAPSILEIDGAKDVAIEFWSHSKTYNMTGWRLGFAAGNAKALAALGKIKTNIDSSATAFVQHAGAVAMNESQQCVKDACEIYKKRRDILCPALTKAGLKFITPKATFYIWFEEPKPDFASYVLEKAHVAITPGLGFGSFGKGYVRFSLSAPTERIEAAVERIANLSI